MTSTEHPQTPASAARLAAEAVRTLNHLTVDGGYESAADVDAALGHLADLVERLPQALLQAAVWLRREAIAGRVIDDRVPGDAGYGRSAAGALAMSMGLAADRAAHLAEQLQWLRGDTAHLTSEGERS